MPIGEIIPVDTGVITRVRGGWSAPPRWRLPGPGVVLCLILIASLTGQAHGQAAVPADVVPRAMSEFRSTDWLVRSRAFDGLYRARSRTRNRSIIDDFRGAFALDDTTAEHLRLALIELLATENGFLNSTQGLPEGFFSYHGNLIEAVASLNDARAIEILLQSLQTGLLAVRGLAALGHPVVDRVVPLARSADVQTRISAVGVLGLLEKPGVATHRLTALDDQAVAQALLRASMDDNHFVRIAAVRGLAYIPDGSITSWLRQIAAADPYFVPGRNGRGPSYPVRDAALEALRVKRRSPMH